MYTDTEGIILRQVKTVNGRRMVLLFSRKYGKISAGTGINEKGRSKSALAMRPFTYGRYELFKNRDSYNINGAEVLKSYYKIGEDVDKYMCASYVLEFTDRILAEEAPATDLLSLLTDFLAALEKRGRKQETLVLAFEVKALALCGTMPELARCVRCGGSGGGFSAFSVKEGGVLCEKCRNNAAASKAALIYDADFGIVEVLRYFLDNPLSALEKIALDDKHLKALQRMIRSYADYHLDIGELKSEAFLKI